MVLRLLNFMGVTWVVEQPMTSLMMYHPRMQEFLRDYPGQVFRKFVWMGAWGDMSPKPTNLYCNKAIIGQLHKELPTYKKWRGAGKIVTHYLDKEGRRRVVGGKLLKSTQTGAKCFHDSCWVLQRIDWRPSFTSNPSSINSLS